MTWPYPSTHPPTHQTIHPPMGRGVSTNFKYSNGIEISWLVQVLFNFDWFWGSPWGVVDGWTGWGGYGCVDRCPMHAHTHMHTHTCTYTHAHTCTCMLNMISMDASMSVAICNFYTCIHLCACVCMHVGTPPYPQMPPDTPHPPVPPQSCREQKTPKFNKSWTNRDNSILFEDSLPLDTPELI